jgi:hypothetical protein
VPEVGPALREEWDGMGPGDVAKLLIIAGLLLVVAGALVLIGSGLGLGRLPGDVRLATDHLRVYAPIATCLVLSVAATIVVNLIFRR